MLSDVNARVPPYRFHVMAQKATELAAEVRGLGQALLAALEKRDAESLALLRSGQEIKLLQAMRQVREKQRDEAEEGLDGLKKYRELLDLRRQYYQTLLDQDLLPSEQNQIDNLDTAKSWQYAQLGTEAGVAGLRSIPDFKFGASTTAGWAFGGGNLGSALASVAASFGVTSAIYGTNASLSAIGGGNRRRRQDWAQQVVLAEKELEQAERQIAAADIRRAIADQELTTHDLQTASAKDTDLFMRDKFTSKDLYDWMVSQISGVYFQSYQLAYDMAKRAERAFRHELAVEDSSFIEFGYWDSLKKGLLAGEKLHYDVKRLEAAYLDLNKREYELTKHVSLALMDPAALVRLTQTGECFFSLPESLYDADHPGHYIRRIKSVSLTIPAVVGPYTGVHATLTLVRSSVRLNSQLPGNDKANYPRTEPDDDRFRDSVGVMESVATSRADNDSGLFELDFRDERYLPFEGQGAISDWRLQMDKDANRFDFKTIADVILHIRYTAREGGERLKEGAKQSLPGIGMRLFSLKHDYPTEWHRFLHPADNATSQSMVVDLRGRFPFHASSADPEITRVDVFLKVIRLPENPPPIPMELYDNKGGTGPDLLDTDLISDKDLDGLHHTHKEFSPAKPTGEWLLRMQGTDLPDFMAEIVTSKGIAFKHLRGDETEDICLLASFARP